MLESYCYFILTFVYFLFYIISIITNNNNKNDMYIFYKRIYEIEKCFNKTKRVTCSRSSKKLYIKRRKSNERVLLLKEYNYNRNDYPIIKNCIYLITIITQPNMYYERRVFRKIYKRYDYVSYLFVMGKSNSTYINKKVSNEIKKHRDIIQFYFLASYFTLILQTYNLLLYLSKIKIHFNWLVKHDTDTFFNIKNLYNLHSINNSGYSQYIWGYIVEYFPSGMGYVIPHIKIKDLIKESTKDINHNCYGSAEDVYIGKLAKRCKIFLFDVRKLNKSIGEGNCYIDLVDKYIMIHRLKPTEIYFLHKIVSK